MRLQIISDLHLEWQPDAGESLLATVRNEDADALILAGDVVSLMEDGVHSVSDVRDLIVARRPALWVHGHTHHSMDYRIGPTRIRCNPFGYPPERNPEFDPRLVIELPAGPTA